MKCIVYKTTNLINEKYYIGVHSKDNDLYLGSGDLLISAIRKYGRDNFKRETLEEFDNQKDAYEYEKCIVTADLVKSDDCYNICGGGYGSGNGSSNPMYGVSMTDERRKNISEGNIKAHKEGRNILSIAGKNKLSKIHTGNQYAKGMTYSHTEEAKEAIREARTGIPLSHQHKKNVSDGRKGKGMGERNSMNNPENRKKVSLSKIGRKRLVHATLPYKMSFPDSDQWNKLIEQGYNRI